MGILCPNTPAFLESIFGIAAAGAVNVGKQVSSSRPGGLELSFPLLLAKETAATFSDSEEQIDLFALSQMKGHKANVFMKLSITA